MINYQECFRYYIKLIKICDEHCTHQIVQWYQENCRFYGDEDYSYPDPIWSSRKWNCTYTDFIDLSGEK
jgi:hypothetical protein